MIFILCTLCQQGISLSSEGRRSCPCGEAFGYYAEDGVHLSLSATPIGIGNSSLKKAIENRPVDGWGHMLEAVLMPHSGFILDKGVKDETSKGTTPS